jgi:hypothetical protein
MTALVAVETFLLVLLALLVAGLLRSHAEILRRLEPHEHSEAEGDDLPSPPGRAEALPASDLVGTTLAGDPLQIGVTSGRNTLLAFMTSGCATCKGFWDAFRAGTLAVPGEARLVVVTKDRSHESPTKLRELASPEIPVVMSTPAWEAYEVPVAPYFVYVDGASAKVHGEGAASSWEQVVSLLSDAVADEAAAGHGGTARALRAEQELRAAGIAPGDPSLYGSAERKGS